jgi:hypothetical protein
VVPVTLFLHTTMHTIIYKFLRLSVIVPMDGYDLRIQDLWVEATLLSFPALLFSISKSRCPPMTM